MRRFAAFSKSFVKLFWVACLCLPSFTQLAMAREASRLWSERPNGGAPLAQVPDFRALAQQLVPTVVSIQVEQRVKVSAGRMGGMPGMPGGMPTDPFDFFHRYFGGEAPREYRNRGLGSGFVIDDQGLLLTNYHVVEDAESIEVTYAQDDGSERKVMAKVLGQAPNYDVALLQVLDDVKPHRMTYLGDSDSVQIGDWVMAVGNPFGLSHSVSVGIISAKERRDIAPSGRQGLYNFLQTDASINPGNSGGPLVNMRGEVIGINSAINAAGSGIGFAIPINMVKDMLPDLKNKGHYARSWLGIKIQPLTDELAQSFGLPNNQGALVSEIMPDSPAYKAQLHEGDVILQFDGKDIRSASDLPLFSSMAGVGKKAPLTIWREGKKQVLTVVLQEFPDEVAQGVQPPGGNELQNGELGMRLADITPSLQQELGLSNAVGAVIKQVEEAGLAARAGLRPGDVIVGVNGVQTPTARVAADMVRRVKKGSLVRFRIIRQGANLFAALRKP